MTVHLTRPHVGGKGLLLASDLQSGMWVPGSAEPNRLGITEVPSAWQSWAGQNIMGGNTGGYASASLAPSQNWWAEWDFVVPPCPNGYVWGVRWLTSFNAGKFIIKVDGVTYTTIDAYNVAFGGVSAYGVTVNGALTKPKRSTLRLESAGKNPTSSDYYVIIADVQAGAF